MHKLLKSGTALAAVILLLTGCYPKGPEYYSDLDLTVTDYDPDYKFGDQKKYWLADTVEYITNIEDDEIDDNDVKLLLEEVASNIEARGYERVDIENPPDDTDFAVTVSVIAKKNTGVGWVPGPPWYPGWGWGPGWGGWYPPYWGGYYTYNFTTGSVIINWWDPQESPAPTSTDEDNQPVHWVATFNGLVSSSKENNAARIKSSINQAFTQSPYIQSNK